MKQLRKSTSDGVITSHMPISVSLLKVEEPTDHKGVSEVNQGDVSDVRDNAEHKMSESQQTMSVRQGKSNESSPCGPKQRCLSYPSFRQLQAQMETEHQQAGNIIQPILDREQGLIKELNCFLSHQDFLELRRKELLHKTWAENVWFPLQKRIEERASSCYPAVVRRRRSSSSHYLHSSHTKGRLKGRTTSSSSEEEWMHISRKTVALPQSRTLCESQLGKRPQNLALAPGRIPVTDQPEQSKSSRAATIPAHFSAFATPDGRCRQCSDCGFHQQAASPRPLSLSSTFK